MDFVKQVFTRLNLKYPVDLDDIIDIYTGDLSAKHKAEQAQLEKFFQIKKLGWQYYKVLQNMMSVYSLTPPPYS